MQMRLLYLLILLTSIGGVSIGQNKSKNNIVSEKLVGSWKFDYALYRFSPSEPTNKSHLFHTDTISFYKDRTFKFRSHNTNFTEKSTNTGNWEVVNNGKTLIHKNRQTQPPFNEPTPDLTFPLKIINANRIRIDYEFYVKGDTSVWMRTPIFFKRIPVQATE